MKHRLLFLLAALVVLVTALAVPCFAYPINENQGYNTLAPDAIYVTSHDDIFISYGGAATDVAAGIVSTDDVYGAEFAYDPDDGVTQMVLLAAGMREEFHEFVITYPYMSMRPDESLSPVTTLVFSLTGGGGQEEVSVYHEYTFYYYDQSGELQSEYYLESRTYFGELVNYAVPLVPHYMPNHVVGIELQVYGDTNESFDSLSFTEPELSDTPYQYGPNLPEHNVTVVTSPNVFEWLSNSIGALLDTPIIGDPAGDYSYTIGNLLFLVVCIPLVVSFLKLFAGG